MTDTSVLVIDDEKENIRYLTTILEENGFTDIHNALDGEEGLKKVKEVIPGLILLDLRMPKKNGIQVFNELKASEQYKDIPVIILTGEGEFLQHLAELREFRDDKEEDIKDLPTKEILSSFITAQPDVFLEKPIEPEPLIANVKKLLLTPEKSRKRRSVDLKALLNEKLSGEIVFQGKTLLFNDWNSMYLSSAAVTLVKDNDGPPDNFVWKTSGNRDIIMSKKEVQAFHSAMTEWIYKLHKAIWKHTANMKALATVDEIEAYDVKKDWPENRL